MTKHRRGLNPAKIKADIAALEADNPDAPRPRGEGITRWWVIAGLCVLTAVLLLASAAPWDQWYLAYVALVPWAVAMVAGRRRRMLWWAYFGGVVFWTLGLYWMTWVTMPGYVPLVLYLSLYWLAAAVVLRRAWRRGWPMWAVLPVVWVALEYLRGSEIALSGFPWFYLAHSQYRCVRLIQVADLTGQYGLSLVVAMVNGLAIDAVGAVLARPAGLTRPWRRLGIGACASAAALAALVGYGTFRLGQQTTRPGLKIGVVQQAFPISLYAEGAEPDEIFAAHLDNTEPLVAERPDAVAWPESMIGHYHLVPEEVFDLYGRIDEVDRRTGEPRWNPEQRKEIRLLYEDTRRLQGLLGRLGCPLLAGGAIWIPDPAGGGKQLPTNSALLYDLDETGRIRLVKRYDKMHVVPFSESVPFRKGWPWLNRQLRRLVPEAMPQLAPGDRPVWFEITARNGAQPGQPYRVVTPICYEGVFDRVCRELVMANGRKRADVMVNLSNDGWFIFKMSRWTHASTELDQHLAQYVFRAVENRVPVVRAVNTGISAHIDSNGRIIEEVSRSSRRKMIGGRLVASTLVDDRSTVYAWLGDRVGDVFAWAVCLAAGLVAVAGSGKRLKEKE
ncbi:MAG TPA: apolipoprotein N-acyltransferase [Phycisphaerae bacterium]|nr:apolipoprotein N-acyltransferase [Phycisphaerae bacterium]